MLKDEKARLTQISLYSRLQSLSYVCEYELPPADGAQTPAAGKEHITAYTNTDYQIHHSALWNTWLY